MPKNTVKSCKTKKKIIEVNKIKALVNKLSSCKMKFNVFGLLRFQNVYSLLSSYICKPKTEVQKDPHPVYVTTNDWRDDNTKPGIMNVNVVLFFNQELKRPDKLMENLKSKIPGLFDDIPTILPMTNFAPPDYPVVQLKSSDGTHRCNISRVNINFSFIPRRPIEDFKEIEKSFIENSYKIVETVIDFNNLINRVGFVLNYFIPDTNPVSKIVSVYINKQIGSANEITIRFNKQEDYNNFILNNITFIKNEDVTDSYEICSGICIQRDINNQVNDNILTFEFISNFIKKWSKEFYKSELDKVIT